MNKILILFFLIIISCNNEKNTYDKTPLENINSTKLLHDGLLREYVLHVPQLYDGETPLPLVLNFHGFGDSATSHSLLTGMIPVANENNFIIAFPQGALLNGSPHWNSNLESPENKSTVDDFGFVESLVSDVSSNYNIDQTKIYATGFSNGGFLVYSLACYNSDLFAAFAGVSTTIMEEAIVNCSPAHKTPIIHFHGLLDQDVPINGGPGLSSMSSMVNFWKEFNELNLAPESKIITSNNYIRIENLSYKNNQNSTLIEIYTLDGGGHEWFNLDIENKNTSEIIWEFFSKHNLNNLN